MKKKKITFVALDDRNSVIEDLSSIVKKNMEATGLQLPPAWSSVRELLEHVWDLQDTKIFYIIDLRNEMAREDFQNGCIWEELVNEISLRVPHSPLEQFEILPLIKMNIGNFYFSFTNSSLFMLLTLCLVLLLVHFVTKKGGGNLVPNAFQSLVELIYDFVPNPVNEQIGGLSGNVKQKFFPCILVTFTFLLFCNLQGMIPYSFTVTSHFLITLGLSFSIFIGITIVGFQKNGLHFLSFLLPAGVPLPLAPFLVLLELISYCFRALSLGIRLFANMMAGHSLVKILSGFAWTMLCMNDLFYFIGDLGLLFIVLALTGLELGVAILQAYVFTILICIYLNDAINLH
uniref:F-ATPase protein 6 n=1 Tax=Rhizophora mucronata TaxID=61149 RepID=A0A2P2MP79_RHIMU